ncbi:MAG TPA: glycosyl hydrolase [Solirubrobacterales bacterium]|nr:glycosyl hydrolase [Solirubrobacterales bacterium]
MRSLLAGIIVVLALATHVASRADAAPRGFFGVVSQAELGEHDFERMRQGRVASLRIALSWESVQPGPATWNWAPVDAIVAGAEAEGVRTFPFVYATPGWVASDPARPPLDSPEARQAWRTFLAALVDRYGPNGELWEDEPNALPIRRWQVWNEPNFPLYWQPRPSPREYAQLLDLSAQTIRSSDPKAKIVAAGLAPVTTGPWPWDYLEDLYRQEGVERNFDEVAIHPYSRDMRGIRLQVRRARKVMRAAGDGRTKLAVTELGIGSRGPGRTSERLQARYLRQAFAYMERKRRSMSISGVDWYAWQDTDNVEPGCSFCPSSGLFSATGEPKLAWSAFKAYSARGDG